MSFVLEMTGMRISVDSEVLADIIVVPPTLGHDVINVDWDEVMGSMNRVAVKTFCKWEMIMVLQNSIKRACYIIMAVRIEKHIVLAREREREVMKRVNDFG
jgi:hypothetical protein